MIGRQIRFEKRACMARSFLRRSAERHKGNVSVPSGPRHSLASTPSRTVCQVRPSAISWFHFLSSLLRAPIRYRRPVSCNYATLSRLDIPRSITQTR